MIFPAWNVTSGVERWLFTLAWQEILVIISSLTWGGKEESQLMRTPASTVLILRNTQKKLPAVMGQE